jgi:pyrroline-5-carboxylate reductase
MKVGVFGCGNMGTALALGIRHAFSNAEFYLFNPSVSKAKILSEKIDGNVITNIEAMPKDLDWYLIAFKPQSLDEFQFDFSRASKIISVLAGVTTDKLRLKFGNDKIIRLMPNTPSAIGLGANLLFVPASISNLESLELDQLLKATGEVFLMKDENDLDLATAFSGSGPALLFEMARIFEEELTRMTDGRINSKKIIAQTFYGSSALMNSEKAGDLSFEELRNQVTSKKGVTFEALEILRKNNLQDIFSQAFTAAYNRTIELSK